MAAKMTVLIPTHGRPTLLGRTLASLAACRLPDGYRETVVVENGAKAGAEAVVAEAAQAYPHLRLRYLHVAWANKSHALNEAIQTVNDGLVVFFDDDVRLDPGILQAYAEAAEGRAGAFYFGGGFGVDYEAAPPPWLLPLLPYSARGVDLDDPQRPPYYLGFNWAAFAEDLKAIGGFDPHFGPGSPLGTAMGDEADVQGRLREAGVRPVDVPSAFLWHYVPRARCTPTWAVKRKYLTGIALGQRGRRRGQRGLVRGSLTKAARSGVYALLMLARRRRPEGWASLASFAINAGKIVGYVRSFLAGVPGSRAAARRLMPSAPR